MTRVAYVCTDPGVPVFGCKGASAHVQAVVRELVRRGMDVSLVAARLGGPPPPGLESVRVCVLPPAGKGPAADRERAAQASDRAVAGVLDRLAGEGPLDLVYERYALWGRTATAWAAAHGVPSVLEVNAPLVAEQAAHRQLVDRPRADAVAVAALSAATAVACVSPAVAEWARAHSGRAEGVAVVPNGVDTDRISPAPRPLTRAGGRPFTVGFVGTLKPWHGVDTLVDAVALLARADRSYRLLLVGDGPRAVAIRERAAASGIGDLVEHTGAVLPADVAAHLHRMDVAAAPYPALDGFYFSPLKLYEYLAAGLPVVASRVGQVADVLQDGRVGVLVPPDDPGALALAIAGLRADGRRRALLAAGAREAAVTRHTWRAVVDRVLGLAGVPLAADPASTTDAGRTADTALVGAA